MNIRAELVGANEVNLVTAAIPDPPSEGLVVKVHYAGVCHSDVWMFEDRSIVGGRDVPFTQLNPFFRHPRVCGHEIAGEVHAIGEETKKTRPGLKVGDHVVVYPWRGCQAGDDECDACRGDLPNLCPKNATAYGMGKDGGFQSYMTVLDSRDVHKVPEGLPLDVACLLGCSALTSYNAVSKIIQAVKDGTAMKRDARVLIVGAGGLGLWAVQWAKQLLPVGTKVAVADVSEEKIRDGKACGADLGVLWAPGTQVKDMARKVKEEFGGPLDAAIDMVTANITVEATQRALRRGGYHVLVGLGGASIPMPLNFIVKSGVMIGVYVGSPRQLLEVIQMVVDGKVKAPPITEYKLEEVQQVVQKLANGSMRGRGVIKMKRGTSAL